MWSRSRLGCCLGAVGKGVVRVEWEESACLCDSQSCSTPRAGRWRMGRGCDPDSIQEWEPSCGRRRELPICAFT